MVFITFIIPGARARFLEAWLACAVREGRALKVVLLASVFLPSASTLSAQTENTIWEDVLARAPAASADGLDESLVAP